MPTKQRHFVPLSDEVIYQHPELLDRIVPFHHSYRPRSERRSDGEKGRHQGSPWALGLLRG